MARNSTIILNVCYYDWYLPEHVFPLQSFKQSQLAIPSTTLHVPPFSHGLFVQGETESMNIIPEHFISRENASEVHKKCHCVF